jgi:hypothetical protein
VTLQKGKPMSKKLGCRYQGFEFGAGYVDSVCIKGQLFDADNCDDKGNLYEPMDYIPCPICRPGQYRKHYTASLLNDIKSRRNADGSFKPGALETLMSTPWTPRLSVGRDRNAARRG